MPDDASSSTDASGRTRAAWAATRVQRRLRRGPHAILILGLLMTTTGSVAAAGPPTGWDEVVPERIVHDATFPTDIDMAPDGAIWYTELEGSVSRFDPAVGASERMLEVPNVVTGRERGLLGLALAADFAQTGTYFLYYSERNEDPDGGMNRLVRVDDGERTVLASLSAALEHNGGRIVIDPDGNLFVGTGENSEHEPAQDLDSLLGKILHMTPEGDPLPGNLKGLVHSYGHRNVYGLAQDPDSGALWAVENMGWRRDEVNIIEPGGNYGYPECEGNGLHGVDDPCPRDKGYVFPIMTFYEDRAAAPTGAAFWRGGFYWASFNEGSIHHIWNASKGWEDRVVYDHEAPVLDLLAAHDGALYFSALDGIWRVDLPRDGTDGPAPSGRGVDDPDAERGTGTIPAPPALVVLAIALVWVALGRRSPRP